jgi:cephalosporin hydroxylase
MPTPTNPKDPAQYAAMAADPELARLRQQLIEAAAKYRYSYNFCWLGLPAIQHSEDLMALQEIAWRVRPDAIIETGIAHGGSLVFHASMLELLGGDGIVVGVDIDIRAHNRVEIERHPLFRRIRMIEGSSIDPCVVDQVAAQLGDRKNVLVVLDSNHTADHVLQELRHYAPFVRSGSYVVVLDTVVEFMGDEFFTDRPWGRGNSPMTAATQFLRENDRFVIDEEFDRKLLLSVAPGGYLRCIAD